MTGTPRPDDRTRSAEESLESMTRRIEAICARLRLLDEHSTLRFSQAGSAREQDR